jgi:hypothetical protein
MKPRLTPLFCAAAIGAMTAGLGGCLPTQPAHMIQGNEDGVVIMFFGDHNATIPLARQHCAQYEKVPDPISVYDDKITYACICPTKAPQADQHA